MKTRKEIIKEYAQKFFEKIKEEILDGKMSFVVNGGVTHYDGIEEIHNVKMYINNNLLYDTNRYISSIDISPDPEYDACSILRFKCVVTLQFINKPRYNKGFCFFL